MVSALIVGRYGRANLGWGLCGPASVENATLSFGTRHIARRPALSVPYGLLEPASLHCPKPYGSGGPFVKAILYHFFPKWDE